MTNLERIVIHKFRKLSPEKQEDVLDFLDLMQQDLQEKITDKEVKQAREILNRAQKRALASPHKSASQLWDDFSHIKNSIAEEYETKNN